ncbi:putative sulfate exporter family transporter [Halobacillus shinanisalinarum]|uniref:Sulfate exporter family transporter n=1 Tax=Halobacillus shinanisalinarum TaxID=2932258 RepID=A0ABY4H4C0_9BACI|nr:putative sulfate exporter family transporter [Halobacillus shinanisalinarum]UOQ95164.1 putative sulfate exporter family transporter [Halobacillus shinanisalinarum]
MAQQPLAKKLDEVQSSGQQKKSGKRPNLALSWIGGIAFTFFIALLGLGLSEIPGFDRVGPLACAIIIAIICRQIWEYPEKIRPGIEFSAKKLLRYAIVLYGLKLNIVVIFNQGLPLLVRDIGTIVFVMVTMMFMAKWLKADFVLSLLLAVGTAVCGAAAIAAISPIVKSEEEDTAIGVGIIALAGTIFALLYTLIRPILPISGSDYGVWSGVSLHEIAHVALAAAPGGEDALAIALLAKLGRVFLLVPLCFILMYWMKKRNSNGAGETKIEFPWFLIGFICMSLFGSYVIGEYIQIPAAIMDGIATLSTFVLTMAMVGLGLNVSFQAIRAKASRPLIAMLITSLLLSVITFLTL